MFRYWKTIGLTASLAMFLFALPGARAAEPNSDSGATTTSAQMRQILLRLDSLERKLDENIAALRQGQQLSAVVRADDAMSQIQALRQQLADTRRALDELRNHPNTLNTTSAYGPTGAVLPTTGTVRLVNTAPAEEVVTVNGLAYHLAPGETRAVAVPAGTFNYEVIGAQPGPQPRTIVPNQTFTVTLFPLGT